MGSKPTTEVLINTDKEFKEYKMHKLDATTIAMKHTGRPISNVALLGAFAKISKLFTLQQIEKAVRVEMAKYPKEIIDKNVNAAKEAYDKAK